jgi:mono/diheme cytochrome c family protein
VRFPLLVLTLAACSGGEPAEPSIGVDTVTVTPVPSPAASRVVEMGEVPLAIAPMHGVVAIGAPSGVRASTLTGELGPVPALAPIGTVRWIGQRGDGVVLATEVGLFHDRDGVLLRSPLTDSLGGKRVVTIDTRDDEVWITTAEEGLRARGDRMTSFSVEGASPELAVGIESDRALVTAHGAAWEIDLARGGAKRIVDVGRGLAFDRGPDGSAHVATERGLLSRVGAKYMLRSFGAPVRAVSASMGSLFAVAGEDLVQVDEGKNVGRAPGALAQGVAVDANGDAWLATSTGLVRFSTGKPVTFEGEVKPFLARHCMGCHAEGKQGAPVRAFDRVEVARESASLILRRLRAQGGPPMPPSNVETLTAADYSVVVRWVAGGMK